MVVIAMRLVFARHCGEVTPSQHRDGQKEGKLPSIGKTARGRNRLTGRRTTTPGIAEETVRASHQSPEPMMRLNESLRRPRREISQSPDSAYYSRLSPTPLSQLISLYQPRHTRLSSLPPEYKDRQKVAQLQQVIASLQEKSKVLLAKLRFSVTKE